MAEQIESRDEFGFHHGFQQMVNSKGDIWFKGMFHHGKTHGYLERYPLILDAIVRGFFKQSAAIGFHFRNEEGLKRL